jgi:hypothetical protein
MFRIAASSLLNLLVCLKGTQMTRMRQILKDFFRVNVEGALLQSMTKASFKVP